jgi:RHS repeat-associated protein
MTLASLSYAYDKNSNPTSITDKAGKQSTFTYDALDRLTKEDYPDRTLSYAYDAAGNRKSLTRRTSSTSNGTTIWTTHLINYAYDAAERMKYAGSTTYAYDKNGNMTSTTAGTRTTNYSYDYEDALTKAGTKTYGRDPFERTVSSTVGTTKTDYLFDGAEAVQQKVGTATTYYTRGLGGQLINRRAGGDPLRYYHHDAIGSVMGLSDSTGALTDAYSYEAFGNVRARTGTNTQRYQYLGNAWDPDAKLLDFHARVYDPSVGRFLQEDPIGGLATESQTLNSYACSMNDPLAHPDPYGLFPVSTGGGDISELPDDYVRDHYYINSRVGDSIGEQPDTGGSGAEPCEAAGPGGSWEQFGVDWWQHFKDTNVTVVNASFLHLPMPFGTSFLTSGKVAEAYRTPTLLKWLLSGGRGFVMGGTQFTGLETGVTAVAAGSINYLVVALPTYEVGVGVGSVVSAIPVYGEACTNIAEWWGNYFYMLGKDDQFREQMELMVLAAH